MKLKKKTLLKDFFRHLTVQKMVVYIWVKIHRYILKITGVTVAI